MKNLFDSELKVMEIIWEKEPVSAKEISLIAAENIGWNKNTTYTVIKKLEAKGFIKREEPGFICTSVCKREEIQRSEANSLVDKLFGGSKKALFSALIGDEKLSREEIAELKELIEKKL
ncbi:MAG: BlaI/MecI/CopY family transcriptional regulator [Clostridia bacterium]|nr:BlaI/MecI/CopY family transcriptional regulator [Clostridia bacterium]